jgi:hypothetical protein
MSREPVTHSQLHDVLEDPIENASKRAKRKQAAAHGLATLVQFARATKSMIPVVEEFEKERNRLGEYDASAAAIIQLATMMRSFVTITHDAAQAIIDLELDR